MTKTEAIALANQYGWTKADAERAYNGLDFKTATERDFVSSLLKFAGPELKQRQYLQASQKGQVTRKKNEIKALEAEYKQHLEEEAKKFEEMRSTFVPLIERLYAIAKKFGLNDPWIEALIKMYKGFQDDQEAV